MYRVLIVDDEATIREGMKCLLDWGGAGFVLAGEASNGEAALCAIRSQSPDIVLIDICMPGMSGLDVIAQAREDGFDGKFIIVSGYSDFKYAQSAIRYGVSNYLTKPIDEDELADILRGIKTQLDEESAVSSTSEHYRRMAHDAIIRDLLLGKADLSLLDLPELHLDADVFMVAIYAKYGHNQEDAAYRFSELLRVTNQDNNSYDNIVLSDHEVLLLKGSFAIQKFNDFLERYERELRPQKDSPLDSLFLTYGQSVHSLSDIPQSYEQAHILLDRRFFCDQEQHTIGYEALPKLRDNTSILSDSLLKEYAKKLLDYLQVFNRNAVAETLNQLSQQLYTASDSIDDIKLFLADLYLQIKEQISHLYGNASIPFAGNADIIKFINEKYYLYEIILYFTEQFEIIMSSLGNSTRDSVLSDILYYIDHNYANNITLENIAPLFGYNSSYLGRIFSKKVGMNFNAYVDHIRIERSKELLLSEDTKIYLIAERVGYRNVDYFHIKFKKYVGISPAEYRKKIRNL